VDASVVILSSHSLFTDGIASRLQHYLPQPQLQMVNPTLPSALRELINTDPQIIIFDITDTDALQFCVSHNLLYELPAVRLIALNPRKEQIRILTSECYPAVEIEDLLEVIARPLVA